MGQGVVPEVEFPIGIEVVTGAFSKNLKNFVVWPGRIQIGAKTDAPRISLVISQRIQAHDLLKLCRTENQGSRSFPSKHRRDSSHYAYHALLRMNVSIICSSNFTAVELDIK